MKEFRVRVRERTTVVVPHDVSEVAVRGTFASQAEAEEHVRKHHPTLDVIPAAAAEVPAPEATKE